MNVAAASTLFAPQSIIRLSGPTEEAAVRQQNDNRQQRQDQARVVQGEVIPRSTSRVNNQQQTTQENLSERQFQQPRSDLQYNARQAVNAYLVNQSRADQQAQNPSSDQIIDVFV